MAFFLSAEYSNIFLRLTPQLVEATLTQYNRPIPDHVVISAFSKAILIFQEETAAKEVCFGEVISSLKLSISTPEDIAEALEYMSTAIGRALIVGKVDTEIFRRFLFQLLLITKEDKETNSSKAPQKLNQNAVQEFPPRPTRTSIPVPHSDLESSPFLPSSPTNAWPTTAHRISSRMLCTSLKMISPGSAIGEVIRTDNLSRNKSVPSFSSPSVSSMRKEHMVIALLETHLSGSRGSQMSPFQIIELPTPESNRSVPAVDMVLNKTKVSSRRAGFQHKPRNTRRSSLRLMMKRLVDAGRMNNGPSLRLRKARVK